MPTILALYVDTSIEIILGIIAMHPFGHDTTPLGEATESPPGDHGKSTDEIPRARGTTELLALYINNNGRPPHSPYLYHFAFARS